MEKANTIQMLMKNTATKIIDEILTIYHKKY